MKNLTTKQAYAAMFLFLSNFYLRTNADDIGGLLGELQLVEDGLTADPAAWHDWLSCIQHIQSKNDDELNSFLAMKLQKKEC